MSEDNALAYVRAATAVAGVPLDGARLQAVALHFGRTAAMARLLDQAALAVEDEPAQLYCPAPFPAGERAE